MLRVYVAAISLVLPLRVLAQGPAPLVGTQITQVSEHVWAILGFPNIGIVVGKDAVLVVDTGLGPRNGRSVSVAVDKIAPRRKVYLTTTHFHPEHSAGEAGFAPNTTLIRNRVQQDELNAHGQEAVERFSGRSPEQADLLKDAVFRKPDVLFDSEYRLNLGGNVKVRLLWFGGAHTKGDELIFVEPDRTLVAGDVVQNKVVPNISGDGGTPSSWLKVLDQIKRLEPQHVLPDHSAPGDGSLVDSERGFISDLRDQAIALKHDGLESDAASERILSVVKSRYPDWTFTSVAGFVKSIYADPDTVASSEISKH